MLTTSKSGGGAGGKVVQVDICYMNKWYSRYELLEVPYNKCLLYFLTVLAISFTFVWAGSIWARTVYFITQLNMRGSGFELESPFKNFLINNWTILVKTICQYKLQNLNKIWLYVFLNENFFQGNNSSGLRFVESGVSDFISSDFRLRGHLSLVLHSKVNRRNSGKSFSTKITRFL